MEADRRVGVAVDFSACSQKALKWAVDNVVRNGDHLILVTVLPEGNYEEGEMQLWGATGSPLIPLDEFCNPHVMKKYGVKSDPETLDIVSIASKQKEIVVLMKIYWGDAREKLCEAVDKIPLDCLVIGNRGLGKIKRSSQKRPKMIEESNIPWRQEQTRDQVLPTEMNQEDKNLINTIREKMENISCSKCICRVPPLHSRDDPEKYFPKLISIGPFHHGKPGLEFMEEQKWRYLNAFLSRSRTPESTLEKCMKAMRDIEHRARKCYREETIHADEFVKTMLLDGCFIVELFLKYTIKGLRRRDDPCFISNQRFFRLRCDLILLENQMPFFVLQKLFQIVPLPKQCSHTLTELAFHFFRRMIPGDILFLQDKFGQGYFSHFLDLIRQCYLPDQTAPVGEQRNILSATALEEKGIRLKRGTAYSIMDIKFNDGVLEIPTLKVQNYTEILFRNLMAMEESCGCGKLVGSYVFLVGRLVPEKADVRVLQRRGIMEGSGDKEDEVVNLFARMCVHVDLKDFYYGGLCEQVNGQIKIRRWSCIRKIMRIWERKFSSFKSCLKFALS